MFQPDTRSSRRNARVAGNTDVSVFYRACITGGELLIRRLRAEKPVLIYAAALRGLLRERSAVQEIQKSGAFAGTPLWVLRAC
jgi:hypothetical protein